MLQLAHIIKQHASLPAFQIALRDANDEPVDLTDASVITFRMHLIGDNTTVRQGTCDVVDATGGLVTYVFSSADTQISGGYIATITAVFPSSGLTQTFPFNDYYLIQVEPDLLSDVDDVTPELVFATVANARSMGYDIEPLDLLRAQGHIEAVCGRMITSLEGVDLGREDTEILKKATVYQAVWLRANPDVEERTDVTQIRTAGLSGESAQLTTDGIILAPLARRLLTRLSWVRSRSIRTQLRGGLTGVHPDSLGGDVIPWKNMG